MALRDRRTKSDVEVITLSSGASVRLFRPVGVTEPTPALLWIHGGGYVIGTALAGRPAVPRLQPEAGHHRRVGGIPIGARTSVSRAAGRLLLGVDLAGRPPRPWTHGGWRSAARSAGGGLAAALALLARDRAEVTPAFQLLVYPMLDDRSSATAATTRTTGCGTPAANQFGWTAYLGDADPQVAVPARRDDLSGLPPAWIGVGTHDLFHDEDLAYAERLRSAGVPCQVEIVPGVFHGFDLWVPKAQVSQRFFDEPVRDFALRTRLAG